MVPFAVRAKHILAQHLKLLEQARVFFEQYKGKDTCHDVCREAEVVLDGTRWRRGLFASFDHSWLTVDGTTLVLDVYPWASGSGPLLVDCCTGSPWATLYKEQTSILCYQVEEDGGEPFGTYPAVMALTPGDKLLLRWLDGRRAYPVRVLALRDWTLEVTKRGC